MGEKDILFTLRRWIVFMLIVVGIISLLIGSLETELLIKISTWLVVIIICFLLIKQKFKHLNTIKDEKKEFTEIRQKLSQLAESIEQAAESGFAETIDVSGVEEIEVISESFNYLLETINNFIKELDNLSEESSATSRKLTDATQRTSKSMNEVSSTLQELTTTTEHMNNNVEEIADGANNVDHLAQDGLQKMRKMESEMEKIMDVAAQAADRIKNLNNASDKIGNIINVISDIAKQTNLLALNAAIEAARAGEDGKGFAVVADEVRELAQDTQDSLEKISSLIDNLGTETTRAVEIIESNYQQIEAGEEVLKDTGSTFRTIASNIQQMVQGINQTAEASEQITKGSQEISAATEEQSEAADEIAVLAQDLADMAAELKETLADTKIGGMELEIDLDEFDREMAMLKESEKTSLKNELGINGEFVITVIARLEPMKGHQFFLKGLKSLMAKHKRVVCLLVGDGSLENQLKQQVNDMGIEGRVKFLGYRTDIQRILAISDLLVLTSRKEGMPPRIVMDAMAAGKAVVATDVAGTRPLIDQNENGILVNYGDKQALTESMEYFINNPQKTKDYGIKGRDKIEELVENFGK